MAKNRFNWTDARALEFARVASGGAYGPYTGAHAMESKLKIYKRLTREEMEAKEFKLTVTVEDERVKLMAVDKGVIPNKRKDKEIERTEGRVDWSRIESELDLMVWELKVERKLKQ